MIFDVTEKLTEKQYFMYDKLCSSMDKENREDTLSLCEQYNLTPTFFMVGCDEVVFFEGSGFAIVIVSGSDKDKEEWKGNFNPYRGLIDALKKAPKNKRGFHYNYWVQARLLKFKIKQLIKKCKTPIRQLILDGHSRGGAIVRLVHIQLNVEHIPFFLMSIIYDPPRSFTIFGWLWYKRNKKQKDICHRIKASGILGVGKVPPLVLGWVHKQLTLIKLPPVRGKLNHTAITEGLVKYFRKRNK